MFVVLEVQGVFHQIFHGTEMNQPNYKHSNAAMHIACIGILIYYLDSVYVIVVTTTSKLGDLQCNLKNNVFSVFLKSTFTESFLFFPK